MLSSYLIIQLTNLILSFLLLIKEKEAGTLHFQLIYLFYMQTGKSEILGLIIKSNIYNDSFITPGSELVPLNKGGRRGL